MNHTYHQLFCHLIFSPFARTSQINPGWEKSLYKYMGGYLKAKNCKPLRINSMPDHIHIVTSYTPVLSISQLTEGLKSNSSRWIRENKLTINQFRWQRGYAAFSVSRSQLDRVCAYVDNQKIHHQKESFEVEVKRFIKKHERELILVPDFNY